MGEREETDVGGEGVGFVEPATAVARPKRRVGGWGEGKSWNRTKKTYA